MMCLQNHDFERGAYSPPNPKQHRLLPAIATIAVCLVVLIGSVFMAHVFAAYLEVLKIEQHR